MSSLKDIMNIDVEPLPSGIIQTSQQEQTNQSLPQLPNQDARYTDTRYQPQPPRLPPIGTLSIPSPLAQPSCSSLSRKRSRRSSKTASVSAFGPLSGPATAFGPGPNPSNPSSSPGRRPSVSTEYMDSRFCEERNISPSAGYSSSYPDKMARGGINRGREAKEVGVRYTPITGKISKAQKGLPVHQCPHCDRRPFSRAEHLRKDLLERHMEKHNEGNTRHQWRDNGRPSRSTSQEFKAPKPPQTPPQQRYSGSSMSMEAAASSFSSGSAPAPIPASPMWINMNMMEPYTPISPDSHYTRQTSSLNQQSYQQAQQYHISSQHLASPISLSMDVPNTYAEMSPIVTCVGVSPSAAYAFSSSAPPYTSMMPSPYTSNARSFQHHYMASKPMNTFSPQAQMARQLSQRLLTRDLLSVDVPHSTPGTVLTNSPLYHSDRGSNSTWSTPSDPTKSHTLLTGSYPPRDRALSAPSTYGPSTPLLDLHSQLRQQAMFHHLGYPLSYHEQAVISDDEFEGVSTAANFGGVAAEGSEQDNADFERFQSENELVQAQFENNGGQGEGQGYMEDFREGQWRVGMQGQWQM